MAVGSVTNAIAILRHLTTIEPSGVNAIARELGLQPSTCFNILKTLVVEDFVAFDPVSKTYSLGQEPGRLFRQKPGAIQWTDWMREELAALAKDYSITCGLWRLQFDHVVLVEVIDSPLSTRIHLSVGQRLPTYIGAMGRCIASRKGLTREQTAEAIKGLRWQQAPDPATHWAEVQASARTGWAIDSGTYMRGVTTVAAALGPSPDSVSHCISSIAFAGQLTTSELETLGQRTAELARQGEARL
ncbi:helix-turn-helix domain-containing protein [Brevundimonas sp.]|uniref:IclR family transcriptional regulator n=1 Tax=Brevundimonas sp. TaxID=1871086 RepID=UPI001A31099F|nr:helix-turn-helix domain-containing protein [Brevundimonas sp.]MBJ7483890.1 helix-turn-helix domain-containing protein [Brevundimonas sp.]